MEINVTFIIQIILFFIYMYLVFKYIWPYLNKVIEKRKKDISISFIKIQENKEKILVLEKEIKSKKKYSDKIVLNIINKAKIKAKKIIDESKDLAKIEYKKIILNAKNEVLIEKKIMYKLFYNEIDKTIYFILIKLTNNILNKKLDNEYIKKLIKNYRFLK